jgi:hydroxymethylglutaryl-CoA reductase
MKANNSSRIPNFYQLSLEDKYKELKERSQLSEDELAILAGKNGLTVELAQHMIENVIGIYALPLGVALNFIINGKEVLVPMAVEEPSIVAGVSFMAKLARENWRVCGACLVE